MDSVSLELYVGGLVLHTSRSMVLSTWKKLNAKLSLSDDPSPLRRDNKQGLNGRSSRAGDLRIR